MILQNFSEVKPTPALNKLRGEVTEWLTGALAGYNPVKIRSNKIIRDAIFGFISTHRHEVNIIDSPILQRLRYIHQNSLAYLTYPSATHTRFEHSLGVMSVADNIMQAIIKKHDTSIIQPLEFIETRLAALLHDCGHGPFSHASEAVYFDMATELQSAKNEVPEIFGGAAGHEMLSYLIVTSPTFKTLLWDKVCELYKTEHGYYHLLKMVSFDRIGQMIVGVPNTPSTKYLTQIINGPFDADKFDYVIRDGYFSGLITTLDVDRMSVSIDIDNSNHDGETIICMDIGGSTTLEQLLFNKMLLFSSMYHHHKVRAAFRQLVALLNTARTNKIDICGIELASPVSYLQLDDDRLICDALQKPKLKPLAEAIRNRQLFRRSLVIDNQVLNGPSARSDWFLLSEDNDEKLETERKIAEIAGVEKEQVCIDFPPNPRINSTAKFSMIRRAPDRPLVPLDSLYPVSGWLAGYEQFRFRSYILGPEGSQETIANAAKKVLGYIDIDYELAGSLAKWPNR